MTRASSASAAELRIISCIPDWGLHLTGVVQVKGHATSDRTNGHYGAMTSANVGYLPPAGPLRWRARVRIMVVTRGPRMTGRRLGPTCRLRPMANISAPWPRHHHRAAQARPPRLFQLGHHHDGLARSSSNPTAAKPRDGRVLSRLPGHPGPGGHGACHRALMAALSMTGSGTVTWPHGRRL